MKTDEPSTSAGVAGDISPISGTVSNLPDSQKPDSKVGDAKKRKVEPQSEKLPNFSRVTPAQLAHIVFPAEGRFQPVRPVSTRSPKSTKGKAPVAPLLKTPSSTALGVTSERYAGGGGILILIDQTPGEPIEFIEPEVPVPPSAATTLQGAPVPGAPAAGTSGPSAPHIALDENAPEAEPPASFEVRFLLHRGRDSLS